MEFQKIELQNEFGENLFISKKKGLKELYEYNNSSESVADCVLWFSRSNPCYLYQEYKYIKFRFTDLKQKEYVEELLTEILEMFYTTTNCHHITPGNCVRICKERLDTRRKNPVIHEVKVPDNHQQKFDLRLVLIQETLRRVPEDEAIVLLVSDMRDNLYTRNTLRCALTSYAKNSPYIKENYDMVLEKTKLYLRFGLHYEKELQTAKECLQEFLDSNGKSLSYILRMKVGRENVEKYTKLIKTIKLSEAEKILFDKKSEIASKKAFYLLRENHFTICDYLETHDVKPLSDFLLILNSNIKTLIDFEVSTMLPEKQKVLKALNNADNYLRKSDFYVRPEKYILKGHEFTPDELSLIENYMKTHHLPNKKVIMTELCKKYLENPQGFCQTEGE